MSATATALLPFSLLLPLLLAAAFGSRLLRPLAQALTPLAALPALLLAALPPVAVEYPWLLLGLGLGVETGFKPFLLLAGLLWTAAGFYARSYLAADPDRARFQFFSLLSYAGNLGLMLALDLAGFYLFFSLMTFSAYGLIVHDGSPEAARAGRVYLVLAVLGEALLLTAILLIAADLGNAHWQQLEPWLATAPSRDWIIGLALAGFGIKMGVVPLHVWLPLAHSYAPVPASAVLSGIIIKAGLVGWLRFLPLGEAALPVWGEVCLAAGLVTAFYGVLTGLPQVRPKTVLAYSSVSQMGLITALVGVALMAPEHEPFLVALLGLFGLHHGLAKGALFLGVGTTAGGPGWSGLGLLWPALALAGAPLTAGYLVKALFGETVPWTTGIWPEWLPLLLALSSGATALLMARLLVLAWPDGRGGRLAVGQVVPWLLLLVATVALPWIVVSAFPAVQSAWKLTVGALAQGFMPLLAGAGVALLGWVGGRRLGWRLPPVPEGDLLAVFVYPLRRLRMGEWVAPRRRGGRLRLWGWRKWLESTELGLQQVAVGGLLLLGLGVGMAGLLLM